MKSEKPTLKSKFFTRLRELAAERPYISFEEIKAMVEEENLLSSVATLKVYLGEAVEEGILFDAGRGWYSGLTQAATVSAADTWELATLLKARFPRLPLRVWSTTQLNPWLEHLIGTPLFLVLTEADFTGDVAECLEEEGWKVYHNPAPKHGPPAQPGKRNVVVRPVRSEMEEESPGFEDFLVDLWRENQKSGFLSRPELETAMVQCLLQNRVNLSQLLRLFKRNFPTDEFLIQRMDLLMSKN